MDKPINRLTAQVARVCPDLGTTLLCHNHTLCHDRNMPAGLQVRAEVSLSSGCLKSLKEGKYYVPGTVPVTNGTCENSTVRSLQGVRSTHKGWGLNNHAGQHPQTRHRSWYLSSLGMLPGRMPFPSLSHSELTNSLTLGSVVPHHGSSHGYTLETCNLAVGSWHRAQLRHGGADFIR